MKKDEPPPDSYYVNYQVAYHLYKDANIARDIARLVKSKEEPDGSQQRGAPREQTIIRREYIECLAEAQRFAIEKTFNKN